MSLNVSKLKVAQLKSELELRKLPTSGLKAVLAKRLQDAIDSENSGSNQEANGNQNGDNRNDSNQTVMTNLPTTTALNNQNQKNQVIANDNNHSPSIGINNSNGNEIKRAEITSLVGSGGSVDDDRSKQFHQNSTTSTELTKSSSPNRKKTDENFTKSHEHAVAGSSSPSSNSKRPRSQSNLFMREDEPMKHQKVSNGSIKSTTTTTETTNHKDKDQSSSDKVEPISKIDHELDQNVSEPMQKNTVNNNNKNNNFDQRLFKEEENKYSASTETIANPVEPEVKIPKPTQSAHTITQDFSSDNKLSQSNQAGSEKDSKSETASTTKALESYPSKSDDSKLNDHSFQALPPNKKSHELGPDLKKNEQSSLFRPESLSHPKTLDESSSKQIEKAGSENLVSARPEKPLPSADLATIVEDEASKQSKTEPEISAPAETEQVALSKEEPSKTSSNQKPESIPKTSGQPVSPKKSIDTNNRIEKPNDSIAEKVKEKSPLQEKPLPLPSPSKLQQSQSSSKSETKQVSDDFIKSDRPPPTRSLYISNLVRPLTINQIKKKLEEFGEYKFFWIDSIRSHVYVTYNEISSSKEAYRSLHQSKPYPPETGKLLSLIFLPDERVEKFVSEEEANYKSGGTRGRLELKYERVQKIRSLDSSNNSNNGGDDGGDFEWDFELRSFGGAGGYGNRPRGLASSIPIGPVTSSNNLNSKSLNESAIKRPDPDSTSRSNANNDNGKDGSEKGGSSLTGTGVGTTMVRNKIDFARVEENPIGGIEKYFMKTKSKPYLFWCENNHQKKLRRAD